MSTETIYLKTYPHKRHLVPARESRSLGCSDDSLRWLAIEMVKLAVDDALGNNSRKQRNSQDHSFRYGTIEGGADWIEDTYRTNDLALVCTFDFWCMVAGLDPTAVYDRFLITRARNDQLSTRDDESCG